MSEFSMNESENVIENMDIPDDCKRDMYETRKSFKTNYLNTVGEFISMNIEGDFNPYVEHTNKGLNLRIVATENIDEIIAIGKFFELELIENNKTNSNSEHTWIRFRF